jgi:hypothetical protein
MYSAAALADAVSVERIMREMERLKADATARGPLFQAN